MKLSIIIPYHNSDTWIGPLLDALLDQDVPQSDYEIFVVDDGSTENPVTLKQYAEQNPNIVLFRQENRGVSVARNVGIDHSCGEWIFFCDSDDLVRRRSLAKMISIAEEHRLDMLFWNFLRVAPDAIPHQGKDSFDRVSPVQSGWDYLINPPADFSPSVSRYLIRREVLVSNRLRFREGMFYQEDALFRLDLMPVVRRAAHVDVDFYFYIQRESSAVHCQKRAHYERYAPWVEVLLERLASLSSNPDTPVSVKRRVTLWQDINAFYMLKDLSLYSPVSLTKHYLRRLEELDAYPLLDQGRTAVRMVRRLMNRPRLWTLICRMIHVLPASLRQKMK